jgi:hypothetical protein
MVTLLHRFPHAVAWVAGHSHVNDVTAYPAPDGGHGFWSVRVAAEADWPQQTRLLELFDNGDGTLSLFGTIVDHAAEPTAPAPGSAAAMTVDDLASVGRTLSYNDHQTGGRACEPEPCGEGGPEDRNVELLIDDPRAAPPGPPPPPAPVTGPPAAGVPPAQSRGVRRAARKRCRRGFRKVRVRIRRNGKVVRGKNGKPKTKTVCRKIKKRKKRGRGR